MILALIAAIAAAEKYAMVFGGADGWGNYSITSDPCRTYDDLIKAGIKPENIIYMTYTTDVTAYMNPFKGMIFLLRLLMVIGLSMVVLSMLITLIRRLLLLYSLLFSLEMLKL